MADDETDRPSLEPPKLFGRRRPPADPAPETTASTTPADEPTFIDVGTTQVVEDQSVDDEPADEVAPARTRRPRRVRSGEPLLVGRVAAALTGLVVGLALLGLIWVGLRGCDAVRGSTSCGTGPGMGVLIVIFVLTIIVGRYLLRAFQVPDPGATSFLAVGLTGVLYLLFLVDVLEGWPTLIVIPAITAGTFVLSWWVTTAFVDAD